MLLPCPYCGPRSSEEFTYLGDATVKRPKPKASFDKWHEFVHARRNPMGPHREFWQHTGGCRAWLVCERNTVTHEVLGMEPARGSIPTRKVKA